MTVNADVGRLYQVLGNLVVNALRYTPSGGTITLQGERIPGSVRLIVRDTGKGITPEDIPSIFDRFWRGDAARSRTEGAGGGLGCPLRANSCWRMVDASRWRASRVKEQRLRSSSRQTMEKHPTDHKNDKNYGCAEASPRPAQPTQSRGAHGGRRSRGMTSKEQPGEAEERKVGNV